MEKLYAFLDIVAWFGLVIGAIYWLLSLAGHGFHFWSSSGAYDRIKYAMHGKHVTFNLGKCAIVPLLCLAWLLA